MAKEAKIDRRNILAVLGIGGALGVSTEALADSHAIGDNRSLAFAPHPPMTQLRIAEALETLAREIRENNVAALGLNVHSEFKPGNWVEHAVTVKVEMLA